MKWIAALLLLISTSLAFGQIAPTGHASCANNGATCTFNITPTSGDLMVCFALNSGSRTVPTTATGWNYVDQQQSSTGGTSTGAFKVGCKKSDGTSNAVGTWTNAVDVVCRSYSGTAVGATSNCNSTGINAGGVIPNGFAHSTPSSANTTASFPAINLGSVIGTSWVMGFIGNSADSLCTPAGMSVIDTAGTGPSAESNDTAGTITATTWPTSGSPVTCTVASSKWLTGVYELKAATTPTPTGSPGTNTYPTQQAVTLAPGAGSPSETVICYTTTGTAVPTVTSPGTCPSPSNTYSAPFPVTQTTVVNAVATHTGQIPSAAMAAQTYTIQAEAPSCTPGTGSYITSQVVTCSDNTPGAAICYTIDGSAPGAATPGTCDSSPTQLYDGTTKPNLTTGSPVTFRALATKANVVNSAEMSSQTYTLKVDSPTADPGTGTYPTGPTVTLADTTPSSVICYTIDGSAPGAASAGTCDSSPTTMYSAPIAVGSSEIIRMLGTKSGLTNSDLSQAQYVLPNPAWATWNGLTIGTSAGELMAMNGITIGAAAGNYGLWNGIGSAPVVLHPKQKFISHVLTGTMNNRSFDCMSFDAATTNVTSLPAPIILAGNLRKVYAKFAGDPDTGGSGNGYTITVLKNGSATGAPTVQILSSTANFENAYTGADVHYAATDTISCRINAVGTPANTPALETIIEYEPDIDDGSTVLFASTNSSATTDATFFSPAGWSAAGNASQINRVLVIPMAGTITALAANRVAALSAGQTLTFTLNKITGSGAGTSSDVGTAIVYDGSSSPTSGVVVQAQTPIAVAQGDRITIRQNSSGTPAAGALGLGIAFKPTTIGQFIIPTAMSGGSLSTVAATPSYITMSGGQNTAGTTESVQQQIATADFSLEGFTACTNISPGTAPRDYTLSLQENGTGPTTTYSTALNAAGYCPVTSANTTYAIPTNYYLYDTKSVANATAPSAVKVAISYIGYIAP